MSAEYFLGLAHAPGDVADCLFRVRQRHQVVEIMAAHARPAQVIGDPRGLKAARELRKPMQMLAIQRISRSDRHRDAVQYDRIVGPHLLEDAQRTAALDHEFLSDYLEPADRGPFGDHVRIMRASQADAHAEVRQAETVHIVGRARRPSAHAHPSRYWLSTCPPFCVHSSALEVVTQPLPLQEFWPLQLLLALLHELCPLQLLPPTHLSCAAALSSAAISGCARNISPTAVASTAPVNFILFIPRSPLFFRNQLDRQGS